MDERREWRTTAETDGLTKCPPFFARAHPGGGGGPHFRDSQGSCWTAYIQEGGNVVRDLRANISSEAGARARTFRPPMYACIRVGKDQNLFAPTPEPVL